MSSYTALLAHYLEDAAASSVAAIAHHYRSWEDDMLWLRQSTASQEVLLGPIVDSTDGATAETGLTIANTDIKVWKAGGTTLASKNSGGATHISGGVYYCTLDATDTDTVGPLELVVQMTGALPVRVRAVVLPGVVYDSLIAGTDTLQVDVTSMATNSVTAAALAADAVTEVQSGLATAAAVAALPTAATIADAVWDEALAELSAVPTVTAQMRQAMSWLLALARNKVTQTATTMTVLKDDGATTLAASTVSDDGTTATRGEFA